MALSLTVGKTYKVKGREYEMGGAKFIHDPRAMLVLDGNIFKRHLKLAMISLLLVPFVGATGVAYAQGRINLPQRNSNAASLETTKSPEASTLKVDARPAASATTAQQPAPAAVPADQSEEPVVTHRKKTIKAVVAEEDENSAIEEVVASPPPAADSVEQVVETTPPQAAVAPVPAAAVPVAEEPVRDLPGVTDPVNEAPIETPGH